MLLENYSKFETTVCVLHCRYQVHSNRDFAENRRNRRKLQKTFVQIPSSSNKAGSERFASRLTRLVNFDSSSFHTLAPLVGSLGSAAFTPNKK